VSGSRPASNLPYFNYRTTSTTYTALVAMPRISSAPLSRVVLRQGPGEQRAGRPKAEASLAFTSPPSHAAIAGRRTSSMLQAIPAPLAHMRRTAHVHFRRCESRHAVPLRARAEETQCLVSGPPGQSVLHDWGWRGRVQIVRCTLLLSKDTMRQQRKPTMGLGESTRTQCMSEMSQGYT
jgi:hypothetical protein